MNQLMYTARNITRILRTESVNMRRGNSERWGDDAESVEVSRQTVMEPNHLSRVIWICFAHERMSKTTDLDPGPR